MDRAAYEAKRLKDAIREKKKALWFGGDPLQEKKRALPLPERAFSMIWRVRKRKDIGYKLGLPLNEFWF